jgi:uncharacterized protein (TIGR00369 family)
MDDATPPDRSRSISWHDPMIGATAMRDMTGLEYMESLVSGAVPPPPIIALMNMRLVSVSPGNAVFECEPDESHYNPIGAVHGGFACTALDSAAGCAVQTTLPAGTGYTSLEIKVSYLRALSTTTGPLTATGRVVKPGKRVAFAEAELTDGEGRVVATASSTLLIFPIPGADAASD